MYGFAWVFIIGLTAAGVGSQAAVVSQNPPIFQPGAPGQAARAITAVQALELSQTTFTPGDVAFMQHMIVHHAQAVEMVEMLETQGADARIKLLGQRIAMSQQAEMELMRGWLSDRGQLQEMPGTGSGMMSMAGMAGMDHAAHGAGEHGAGAPSDTPLMPGMLSPLQMQTLKTAQGPEFDRLFLQGMIQHHQGALDMVEGLLAQHDGAQDPLLSDFTTSVVADQSSEILRMQNALSGL